tara:strand:+ start:3114 stop:3863 length:750 start_codon:yes stop_codon:yes gene_type:complete
MSDNTHRSKLDQLEAGLVDSSNYWVQFKKLFLYYCLWYKSQARFILLSLGLLFLCLFLFLIPHETPNFNLSEQLILPTPPLALSEAASWTTEYLYHLLAIALLLVVSTFKKSNYLRLIGMAVLVTLIFSTLSIRVSKVAFGRLRPIVAERMELSDTFKPFNLKHKYHSFPSGHTSSSFSTTTTLLSLNPILCSPLIAYATYIGYTRIHLRQHYPSDVIAGASIGIVSALPMLALSRKITVQKRKARSSK